MCIFLCFKKHQKKKSNDDDPLLYNYIYCKKCNRRFTNDLHYTSHILYCFDQFKEII